MNIKTVTASHFDDNFVVHVAVKCNGCAVCLGVQFGSI
jgi:Fe-S-cluster-containing hydrogenase component 2